MANIPPRPPPPPGALAPGGPGPNFRPQGANPPPPPNMRPQGPPSGPFQIPMRNSTRFVDVTPRVPLGEAECKKKLTTYESHTIRKIIPRDPKKEKPSWAKSDVTRESLSPEEVLKQVKKLNEGRRSVSDKKQTLSPFQQRQVNQLLDELNSIEGDVNFEWSLAQLDSKIRANKNGQRETEILTCFVKRAPRSDVNSVGIYNALERQKAERMAAMTRPPPPPPPQPQQQPHPAPPPQQRPHSQGGHGQVGGGGPPGIIKLNPDQVDRGRKEPPTRLPRPRKRSNRRYQHGDDTSSKSSIFTSDTESTSSGYESENTSLDSISDQQDKRRSNHGWRRRGRSKHREHRRQYYVDDAVRSPVLHSPVIHSPEPRRRDSYGGGPIPTYVPEVPRAIPSVPHFDPVTAAYQAGRVDADAERFGLDRMPRVRPIAPERAVVSYGRLEPRYAPEPRLETRIVDPRYMDELDNVRYLSELRRREAEDYIDRTSEPRLDYINRRGGEQRVIYPHHNPFAPVRRYPSSHGSY